jgi:phosphonate transport system substrate-binding protein
MKPDSVFRGIIVARKSKKLKNIRELTGQTVSFPAKTALAAAMMPLYFLHENGLDVKNDIKLKFVGSQFSSIMNAYTGDAIAAATWPPPWEQWKRENPKMAEEMEMVWITKPLVNNGFVAKGAVDSNISSEVARALVELDKSEKGAKILKNAGFEGFEYADETKYMPVKKFLENYDRAIGLPK